MGPAAKSQPVRGANANLPTETTRQRQRAGLTCGEARPQRRGVDGPSWLRGLRCGSITGVEWRGTAGAPSRAMRVSSWEPATCCDRRPKQDFRLLSRQKVRGEETNLVHFLIQIFPYDITHARLVCWGVGGCLPGRWPPLSCVCGICCCEAPRTSCRCPPPRSSGDGGPFPPPANPGATAALFSYACHLGLAWKAACISPVWRRRAGRHVGGRHGASRPFQRAGRAWQAQRARRPRPRSAASS